jgi:hypothetical protein
MASRHARIDKDSSEEEWQALLHRLEGLSDEEVRTLADRLGLRFVDSHGASRDDYINLMDEAYWDDLEREYARLMSLRKR